MVTLTESTDGTVTNSIRDALREKSSGKIVVVFRKKKFLTDLPDFDLTDCVSILLIAEKGLAKLQPAAHDKFDFIVSFQMLAEEEKPVWRDLSSSKFSQPTQFLRRIRDIPGVISKDIYLVANEEPTLYYAGQMRAELDLAGYHETDLLRFLDKFSIKNRASQNGIITAKSVEIDGKSRSVPSAILCENIASQLRLPFFIKPRFGCALVGCWQIETKADFIGWLERTQAEPYPYLIEEKFRGTEVAAYTLVKDGQFLMKRLFKNVDPISAFVLERKKLAKIQIGETEVLYKNLSAFCNQVLKAFQPPDGIFSLQAFEIAPGKFALLEVSCRMPGGMFTSLILQSTGVSVESLHIMMSAGIDVDLSLIDRINQGPYLAYIRCPREQGTVTKLIPVPKLGTVKNYKWYVEEGQELQNPRALAHRHEVVSIEMWSEDYRQLSDEFDMLVKDYRPLHPESSNYEAVDDVFPIMF